MANARRTSRPSRDVKAALTAARNAEDGRRLEKALKDLGLTQTRAAAESGLRQGNLTEIIHGARSFSREVMRALGTAGISADYLLGRDVAPSWKARATVASAADGFVGLLESRRPLEARSFRIDQAGATAFVERLADDWWKSRLYRFAEDAGRRYRELANAIQASARTDLNTRARLEADDAIRRSLWCAARLDPATASWGDVADLTLSVPASRFVFGTARRLETPFNVGGDVAFLWSGSASDIAIFLEPSAKWGQLGPVRVKKGTKRRARFLLELDASPEAELPRLRAMTGDYTDYSSPAQPSGVKDREKASGLRRPMG